MRVTCYYVPIAPQAEHDASKTKIKGLFPKQDTHKCSLGVFG